MKKINPFFALFFSIFSIYCITSCSPKPLDIDLPIHQPKLVVHSQVIPEHFMLVGLSKSFSSLAGHGDDLSGDSAFLGGIIVEHALVTIKFANKTETLEHQGGGLYVSADIHQYYGQTYTLYVKDSVSGLSCTSTSTMLPLVDFDSIKPVVERKPEGTTVYMQYGFSDVPGVDNYYMINIHVPQRDSTLSFSSMLEVNRKQPNMILLSDKLMTDGKYFAKQKIDVKLTDTIAFTLSNISEEYYKFLAAYQKSGKLFNQITGEPINYPTNITGGYGFFNTHNPAIKVFYMRDY